MQRSRGPSAPGAEEGQRPNLFFVTRSTPAPGFAGRAVPTTLEERRSSARARCPRRLCARAGLPGTRGPGAEGAEKERGKGWQRGCAVGSLRKGWGSGTWGTRVNERGAPGDKVAHGELREDDAHTFTALRPALTFSDVSLSPPPTWVKPPKPCEAGRCRQLCAAEDRLPRR